MLKEWFALLRREFDGYGTLAFKKDFWAGLTVAAVALPLALAFGVASGADAAAGLVTAVIAGVLIGGLGGAPYQISGPTGAMSAILLVLADRYGLDGVWIAGSMAGAMMIVAGLFRLGRVVSLIPAPVISGFTSGIAIIIAVGQIDYLLGLDPKAGGELFIKLGGYFTSEIHPNWEALLLGGGVIITMAAWPRVRISRHLPASLVGIIAATVVALLAHLDVPMIGSIPRTILLDQRLSLDSFSWQALSPLIVPAMSIAALGSIESLLCGAVAGNMTGIRMHNSVELVGQGIGNVVIPFFGGVPATAAIARTSVNVKSGSVTRMSSVIHGLTILLCALLLAPWIERIPLAALAGVLVVTAWRMNEWHSIRFFFGKRLKHAMLAFSFTLVATVVLDLTQAIVIGFGISSLIFMAQMSDLHLSRKSVDAGRLAAAGHDFTHPEHPITVYYLSGPLFFAAARKLTEEIEVKDSPNSVLILSMRGVPLVDATGIEVLREVFTRQRRGQGDLLLASLQPKVESLLGRTGFLAEIGADRIFWSSDKAILSLGARPPDAEGEAVEEAGAPLVSTLVLTPHKDRSDQQL